MFKICSVHTPQSFSPSSDTGTDPSMCVRCHCSPAVMSLRGPAPKGLCRAEVLARVMWFEQGISISGVTLRFSGVCYSDRAQPALTYTDSVECCPHF